MDTFVVQGGKKLHGRVRIMGAKNAAAPIIAATTLINGECTLRNVPRIADIELLVQIIKGMGAHVRWDEGTLSMNCSTLDPSKLDFEKVSKVRVSILLLGCLAQRFGEISLALPGGCSIGSRPLDAHLEALQELGYEYSLTHDVYRLRRTRDAKREIVMKEFSVTATENVLMAAVLQKDKSLTIKCCAAEHVVQDLCWFLSSAGARIEGIGTHTLHISGVDALQPVEYTVMPDPIETGTFITLAAATQSELVLENTAPEFLAMELRKFEEIGVHVDINDTQVDSSGNYSLATMKPRKIRTLQAIKKIHPMPYPGFAADLIQPFALLMTQAQGISLVHDWMYDGRMRYVTELQKMGANITILDPHRIMVSGPTPLYGKEITSYDLRAGATLVLAALLADGTTTLNGINQVDRGYERLDERLRALGASIIRK